MNNLRKLRMEKNLTQEQIAILLGTATNTISQYETGKREPSLIVLKKLSQILECGLEDLID